MMVQKVKSLLVGFVILPPTKRSFSFQELKDEVDCYATVVLYIITHL